MSKGETGGVRRNLRFFGSLLLPVLFLIAVVWAVSWSASRMQGGWGVFIAICGGGCLGLGGLLSYHVGVDWLNLRVIRKRLLTGGASAKAGETVAFSGAVRLADEPLVSPFGARPCAAWTYLVVGSRRSTSSSSGSSSRQQLSALGFRMLPTRIDDGHRQLQLRSFPSFEDSLRENARGGEWGQRAAALLSELAARGPRVSERESRGRLLEARHSEAREAHREDYVAPAGVDADSLQVTEEWLPLDHPVCVVGTLEQDPEGLSGRRPRIGPNLMLYRGSAAQVLERVGAETAGFIKACAVLLLLAALLLGLPLLPESVSSKIPGVRSLVTSPDS